VSALGLALFLPGVGQMSFRDALSLLAPYSPRLAYNFIDPTNSLFQGNTLTPVTSVTNPVGVVIDQTQGGLGNLGAELAGSLPAPTISNNAGSVGAWNSGTRTMTNTGSTVAGFPRFRFNLGLVAGRHYLVTGQLSGDRTQLTGGTGIRLTDSGTANTVPYNSSTGVFYGIVPSASNIIEFVTELNGAESITIDSLSVREIPVITSQGTSTVIYRSQGDGITGTAGTAYDIRLGDVGWIPCSEGSGGKVSDVLTDTIYQIMNGQASNWTTKQDTFHYNLFYGFYNEGGVFIPASQINPGMDTSANDLSNPPVVGHNGAESTINFSPVTDSWFEGYSIPGADLSNYAFDGDPGDISILIDTATREAKFRLENL